MTRGAPAAVLGVVLAVLLTVLLTVLAACSGTSAERDRAEPRPGPRPAPTTTSEPPAAAQYVALGDSYQAAPGVPDTSGADGCFRSSGNYAQRVAAETGLTVTDVTCSGASSDDVLANQVPAITPATELVTIGIGGNDFGLFAQLIGSCLQLADTDPDGSPCADASRTRAEETLTRIEDNIGDVLDRIEDAAPDAEVVVVGYPALLPPSGSCPELVPLAPGDYPFVNAVAGGLSDALRAQADRRGLDFVDVGRASRGHDICSAEPWVNGATVAEDGTIPFHPFAIEQEAVARMVVAFL